MTLRIKCSKSGVAAPLGCPNPAGLVELSLFSTINDIIYLDKFVSLSYKVGVNEVTITREGEQMTYTRQPTTMSTKEIACRILTYYGSVQCSIGCKPSTISKLCERGKLRGKKVQGKWRITEAAASLIWPAVFDATGGREG